MTRPHDTYFLAGDAASGKTGVYIVRFSGSDAVVSPLEAQEAHFGGDAVWSGADEEEPLGREVGGYDHVAGIWNRFHEHIPGDDEV